MFFVLNYHSIHSVFSLKKLVASPYDPVAPSRPDSCPASWSWDRVKLWNLTPKSRSYVLKSFTSYWALLIIISSPRGASSRLVSFVVFFTIH